MVFWEGKGGKEEGWWGERVEVLFLVMPRTKGAKQYGDEEVVKLLSIVEQCHPVGRKDWERLVTVKYNKWAEKHSCEIRDWESLRKKFTTLSNVREGGEDVEFSPEIRLAKKIRQELNDRPKKRVRLEEYNGDGDRQEREEDENSKGAETSKMVKLIGPSTPGATSETVAINSPVRATPSTSNAHEEVTKLWEKKTEGSGKEMEENDANAQTKDILDRGGGTPSRDHDLTHVLEMRNSSSTDASLMKEILLLMKESSQRDNAISSTILVSIQNQLAALQNQVGTLESTINHMNMILLSNRGPIPTQTNDNGNNIE